MTMDSELKPMLLKSVVFHIAIVLIFTVKTVFFPTDISEYQATIRVDLVGLPEKKSPDQPIVQEKPAASEKLTPKPTSTATTDKKESKKEISKEQNSALNKLKTLTAIEKLKNQQEEQKKAAQNQIKGNVLSPGTALRGLNKLQFDEYIGSIDAHVKNNWALPEWMLQQQLRAEVMVRIDSQGNLIERRFLKKSGNSDFDQRVWSAIEKSSPFPIPPEKFVDLVGVQGITFAFPE